MTISETTLAAGVGAGVTNVPNAPMALNVNQKVLLIGTGDPAVTVPSGLRQFLSPEAVGAESGFGFMMHALADGVFKGNPTEVWGIYQDEPVGAVQADGTVTFTGPATETKSFSVVVAGKSYSFVITSGDDATAMGGLLEAAITADPSALVTADNVAGVVTLTAKSAGPWGNGISLWFPEGQIAPTGVTAALSGRFLADGAGIPDITEALAVLGAGDAANQSGMRIVIHGYGQDEDTQDALSEYNGIGDTQTGLYANTVAMPFRVLDGSSNSGMTGYTTDTGVTDGRRLDRTNCLIAMPGWLNHPAWVAAQIGGIMSRIQSNRASENLTGVPLVGMSFGGSYDPADSTYAWSCQQALRDSAMKLGLSTIMQRDGSAIIMDLVSMYHPNTVSQATNAYRDQTSLSKIMNMLYNIKALFQSSAWQGITIVSNTANVTNDVDRLKVRDVDSAKDAMATLLGLFEGKAWLFESQWAIEHLAVSIRELGNGFNIQSPVYLSRDGVVYNINMNVDANIGGI